MRYISSNGFIVALFSLLLLPGGLLAQNLKKSIQKQGHTFSVLDPSQLTLIRNNGQSNTGHATPFAPMSLHAFQGSVPADIDKLVLSKEEGLPIFIEAKTPQLSFKQGNNGSVEGALAYQFLTDHKDIFRMEHPTSDFDITKIDESERSSKGIVHVRMSQNFQGIPVYASEIAFHFYPGGKLAFGGRYQPDPQLANVVPNLDDKEAAAKAVEAVAKHVEVIELNENWQEILDYTEPETELVVYRLPGRLVRFKLAYHVTVRPNVLGRFEYFIDAETGDVLHHFDHTCSLGPSTGNAQDLNGVNRNLNLWVSNGTYYMVDTNVPMYTGPATGNNLPGDGTGFILTGDMNNTSINSPSFFYAASTNPNNFTPVEVSAHYNSRESYEYFRTTFNRNSINGNGGDVVSFVNVADENGSGMDNAFWNGQAMFYGNGASAFFPLAGSKDVGGHEMSHGVVQETAGLEYQGESGALNESFADIFGVMIDRDDWRLGEDVVKTSSFPSGALRDMANPNQGGTGLQSPGWQPAHMNDKYTGTQDNGGVHINSGIVNRCFYLFATSAGVGKEKAEQVYYRALDMYLTRSSQFLDSRFAVIKAAEDLNGGAGNAVALAAAAAFDAVGIVDPNGGSSSNGGNDYETDVQTNPGQQYIISNDVNPNDINTWYHSDTQGSNNSFQAWSQTKPQSRMSVRDDGQFGYFVGEDKKIYEMKLDPANNNTREVDLQAQLTVGSTVITQWDNVAISKDGFKLAMISTSIDTSIYIFDFSLGNVRAYQYKLYTPTTAQGGASVSTVLYADAISWDFSGEYLMYDAFNRIPNPQPLANDLEYWDINVIKVWDNATNGPGDGNIIPLFNLEEGENVFNAEFSSNSPYIIAFDFVDEATNFGQIYGSNIEQSAFNILYNDIDVLGYPNFSTDDSRIIINDIGTVQGSQAEVLSQITLGTDKISAQGAPSPFIGFVRFATWYALGTRVITSNEGLPTIDKLRIYPNPTSGKLNIDLGEEFGDIHIEVHNTLGQLIKESALKASVGESLSWDISNWETGIYTIRVEGNNGVQVGKFVKK